MGCSSCSAETRDDDFNLLQPIQQFKSGSTMNINTSNLIGIEKDSVKKKYKVIEKIGSGSFGKVFKVKHLVTEQLRAMKMIKKDSVNYQDDNHEFLKEIEVLSNIDHPNIIK